MKINLDRLNEITGGDESVNQMLLGLFQKTYDRCLDRLKAISTDNSEAAKKDWHDTLHELKGAAANLGFDELFEICKNFEAQQPTQEIKLEVIRIISELK
jgi:HPt (histidine-containing phosphotransfer) domain-containing protein